VFTTGILGTHCTVLHCTVLTLLCRRCCIVGLNLALPAALSSLRPFLHLLLFQTIYTPRSHFFLSLIQLSPPPYPLLLFYFLLIYFLSSSFLLFLFCSGLLSVPAFKALTGLPPYLGMLAALGVLWTLTDAIHAGEGASCVYVCACVECVYVCVSE
jgi:hypothetical protein